MTFTKWMTIVAVLAVLGAVGGGVRVAARQDGAGAATGPEQLAKSEAAGRPPRQAIEELQAWISRSETQLARSQGVLDQLRMDNAKLEKKVRELEARIKGDAGKPKDAPQPPEPPKSPKSAGTRRQAFRGRPDHDWPVFHRRDFRREGPGRHLRHRERPIGCLPPAARDDRGIRVVLRGQRHDRGERTRGGPPGQLQPEDESVGAPGHPARCRRPCGPPRTGPARQHVPPGLYLPRDRVSSSSPSSTSSVPPGSSRISANHRSDRSSRSWRGSW